MVGALSLLVSPARAQRRWDAKTAQTQFGVYHDPAPRREGENRWGWSAGVHLGVSIAHRIHALGTFSFLRVNNFVRATSNGGGFMYADETMLATIGVGFDLVAHRNTRLMLSVEAGPAWSRSVETDRFGSPLPGAAITEAFSLSVAAVAGLSLQRALTSDVAVDLAPRFYVGGGGVAPGLELGLAFRIP